MSLNRTRVALVTFAAVLFVTATAAAQTTTPAPTPAPTTTTTTGAEQTDLSTTQDIQPQDLGVNNPTFLEFFKRRMARVFTRNAVKRAKLDLELSNLILLRARQAASQGNSELANQLVDRYNEQIGQLRASVTAATVQLSPTNPEVAALLDRIVENNLLAGSALDKMALKATGEFNKKLLKAKLEALKDVSKVLAKENLTPEELAKKLEKISNKLAEKETKAERKLAKRLATIEEIDDLDEEVDEDLAEALEKARDKEIEKVAKHPAQGIGDAVREIEGSTEKHILVLQEVLKKAPEQAKPAIQAAIDRSIERLRKRAEKDIKELNRAIDDDRDSDAKEEMIKKLKDKFQDNEKLKKELERKEERLKKAGERELERLKKKEEQKNSGTTPAPTPTRTPTTTPTPAPTSGTSGTSEREAKIYEVKFKDSRFDTSNLPSGGVAVGESVKFKNDDDESVQIQSNPHPTHTGLAALNIGVLAKSQEKTVKFEKAGTFGFHNHLNTSVTGSITVK